MWNLEMWVGEINSLPTADTSVVSPSQEGGNMLIQFSRHLFIVPTRCLFWRFRQYRSWGFICDHWGDMWWNPEGAGRSYLIIISSMKGDLSLPALDKFIISRTIFNSNVLVLVGISTFNIEFLPICAYSIRVLAKDAALLASVANPLVPILFEYSCITGAPQTKILTWLRKLACSRGPMIVFIDGNQVVSSA